MIANARDKDKIATAVSRIDALNKPSKGDKPKARKLNDQALILMKQSKDSDAVPLLQEAHRADPSDVEVVNNLAAAVLNTSFATYDFSKAKELLVDTLLLKPNRHIAWANFGYLYAMEGNESAAINCYINFYQFAPDKQKAFKALTNRRDDPNPVLSRVFATACEYISTAMPPR